MRPYFTGAAAVWFHSQLTAGLCRPAAGAVLNEIIARTKTQYAARSMALVACFVSTLTWGAAAEWRPQKNVEVVSASAAGGAADGTARLVQRLLQEKKLIPVSSIVVNKPGGQQTVAMSYLAQQPGDAHYIAVASTPLLSNFIIGASKQHYTDFTPLALLLPFSFLKSSANFAAPIVTA